LKLKWFNLSSPSRLCFHLTYEELKLLTPSMPKKYIKTFSSYLWGIQTLFSNFPIQESLIVFILPMRNWNWLILIASLSISSFSSYLWGIETYKHYQKFPRYAWFSSYLWGIETTLLLALQVVGI